jgi:hypothetical protein
MDLRRILRHIVQTRSGLQRRFGAATLGAIERAVHDGEASHDGEVRFAVEGELGTGPLLAGQTPRQRALEVFAQLHVWDTERNNGVLVYLLLADRTVEIVADRGFNGLVADAEWQAVCRVMEADFRAGHFEAGACRGIAAVHALIARHFPARDGGRDELPDRPVLL